MSESTEDPLLDQIRSLPITAVAERANVSRDTIYRLLAGETVKESTREAIAQAARDLVESGRRGADSDGAASPVPARQPVPPGADSPGAWWARMDEARKQLGSMARIADELASMARVTESTVGGLLEAGVLTGAAPSGAAPGYPRQVITTPEQDARAAREAAAGRAKYEREEAERQEAERQEAERRRRA